MSIENESGMLPILEHVRCYGLSIKHQTLNTEKTQALVQAMGSRAESVNLYICGCDSELWGPGQGSCAVMM